MTVPTATSAKPGQAQRQPISGLLQRGFGDDIAETHRDQRREHIAHRGAVRGDRAVVAFRVADPGVQRAAHEHLPRAEQQRDAEADEGQPEMREDEPLD